MSSRRPIRIKVPRGGSRRQLDKSSLECFAEEECPLSTDDFDALEVVGTPLGVVKRKKIVAGTGRIFATVR